MFITVFFLFLHSLQKTENITNEQRTPAEIAAELTNSTGLYNISGDTASAIRARSGSVCSSYSYRIVRDGSESFFLTDRPESSSALTPSHSTVILAHFSVIHPQIITKGKFESKRKRPETFSRAFNQNSTKKNSTKKIPQKKFHKKNSTKKFPQKNV